MSTQDEIENAALYRVLASEDGKLMLAWLRKVAQLESPIPSPTASDEELRHMSGRQWIVGTMINKAAKATL